MELLYFIKGHIEIFCYLGYNIYNYYTFGGYGMKVVTYMCEKCFEPHVFNPDDTREEYLCPKCGERMLYFGTEEINPATNKVINAYADKEREIQAFDKSNSFEFKHLNPPTVTCPYCQSTNTKKISGLSKAINIGIFGIFALGKTTKQFHCNNCKVDF